MDAILIKKAFPYFCKECNEYAHTLYNFSDKCGTPNSLRKTINKDYKIHNRKK